MPRADFGKITVGEVAAFVKYGVVNRLVIDRVGSGLAQLFTIWVTIGKRPFFQVKGEKRGAQRRYIPGLELVGIFGGKICCVGIGHVVDQIHLTGAQGGEPYSVVLFGTSNKGIEIGQIVAFRIGFKVVFVAL